MTGRDAEDRALDFIVIGTQKGGTTSLWRYLERHPEIAMPPFKEAPVFCMDGEKVPEKLSWLMSHGFGDVSSARRLGTITPDYMRGVGAIDVPRVADRIVRTFPDIRLIALLRDPIERAMSQYRMSVRRGLEPRSFDAVVDELLVDTESGRSQPDETNSYLAQGEYARILSCYEERFPADHIHVEQTSELAERPEAVIDRLLAFLGLAPGYRPAGLARRHHRSGMRPRLDVEGERLLRAFMKENVWPRLGDDAKYVRHTFDFFMETWNVIPDDRRPALSERNRERLEAHFRADGERLVSLGHAAPWTADWDRAWLT